jgi:hypothetical protein
MLCPVCGKNVNDGSKFCQTCGAKTDTDALGPQAGGVTKEVAAPLVRPVSQRNNKIVLLCAIAVVILVGVGVFWAVGGPKKGADMAQVSGDAVGDNATKQVIPDPAPQTPEVLNQTIEAMQLPADNIDTAQTPPYTGMRKSAPGPELDGRWEGTWHAGFNDSGSCAVNISQNRFSSLCYDTSLRGRIIEERRGYIRFEGGASIWSCRRLSERGRPVLKCSFSVNGGASGSKSGDLSLYR